MNTFFYKKIIASIISFFVLSAFTTAIVSVNAQDIRDGVTDYKITEKLSKTIENGEEKIPVYIWYQNINMDEVEQQVSQEIGFSEYDINEDYAEADKELLEELNRAANGDYNTYLKSLMKNHLKLTERSRKEEKDKTDKYIDALYDRLNIEYVEKSNQIIKENSIQDEKILFISRFSPLIVAELSPNEIYSISKKDNIDNLDFFEDFEMKPCVVDMGNCFEEMEIEDIATSLQLTGEGVKIGIYDWGNVSTTNDSYAIERNFDPSKVTLVGQTESVGRHATYVASVAAGREGIAPDSSIISASARVTTSTGQAEFYSFNALNSMSNLEALINSHPDIINCSLGDIWPYRENNTNFYSSFEKYIDDLIVQNKILIVIASGNEDDDPITAPGLAFNCVSVNGFSNNTICDYSYNHGSGCFKPDVIASTFASAGTSTSAPVITGMLALLYQYKPNLRLHPELAKAILLGSVHQKLQYADGYNQPINEPLSSGLTDRQGAGIPNMYRMISMVAQHSYGYGVFNSSTGYSKSIPIYQPLYGASNMNVSMAYLQTDVTAGSPSTCDDYDISLTNPSLTSKYSVKNPSASEMIYTAMSGTNNNYTLNISRFSGTMTEVKYAYAWSTDNMKFFPTRNETGIYRIRNSKSNKYLSYSSNSNDITVEDYANDASQYWIIDDDGGIYDYVKSANGNDENIIKGVSISSGYYKASKSTNASYLTLYNDGDGTFGFERFENFSGYRLGVYNNSTASGVLASWYSLSHTNESQKWYLEPIGIKCGDVDMDGEITNLDASIVLSYYVALSGSGINLSNLQYYLADFNGNGVIDAVDSSAILAYIS